jgi:hypothetical protein
MDAALSATVVGGHYAMWRRSATRRDCAIRCRTDLPLTVGRIMSEPPNGESEIAMLKVAAFYPTPIGRKFLDQPLSPIAGEQAIGATFEQMVATELCKPHGR